ncbi:hypothetical protein LCGC14_2525130 [marine sediment metagenome]|uniref:Motility protein B-like N-terminal domain-containing protein n=1 Tax=marine sediment metagenome TaxID=412755 RepID=A0A0F9D6S0_9ZZZZ
MPRRQNKQADDEGSGPGAWIVTFSDCMTLLLCFFVMLVSFSSFDEVSLNKIAGAFNCENRDAISDQKHTIKDSIVPPRPRQIDRTKAGSEHNTDHSLQSTRNPRRSPDTTDTAAHRARQVLHIPSGQLFWGKGSSFVQSGRNRLRTIASFMKRVPCQVIIGEIPGADEFDGDEQAILARGLSRSWTLMQYLTVREGLPADRFRISGTHGAAPRHFRRQPVMEVTLLARDTFQ